jgi:hypothetical protein
MLRLVGIDIGRHNTALASVLVTHPSLCPATTTRDLQACWNGQRVRAINLELGGGPHVSLTQTLPVLWERLVRSWWGQLLYEADLVVIEQQNGQMAPHNFALQSAMHMFCLERLPAHKVVVASNQRKLARMAAYGMIQPRDKGAKSTRRNKSDVTGWAEQEVAAGRLSADWKPADCCKSDDLADALTHALAVWWELRETPALRRALKLRKPANPYPLPVASKTPETLDANRPAELHESPAGSQSNAESSSS